MSDPTATAASQSTAFEYAMVVAIVVAYVYALEIVAYYFGSFDLMLRVFQAVPVIVIGASLLANRYYPFEPHNGDTDEHD